MRFKIFKSLVLLLFASNPDLQVGAAAPFPDMEVGITQEFTKTINREFATVADGTTALYNKYGKVAINTWSNNSVKIDITIVVNASSQSAADQTFGRINVNFTNTPGYVKAETVITDRNNGWSIGNLVNWGGSTCEDFKINYTVWMPQSNQLDLKNKYGNSSIGQINGKVWAEIKYGDLRADGINNSCELWLGYGKANIQSVQNISGDVSYGELDIRSAKNVELETKYSDLDLEQADEVRIQSKYDDFDFGTLGSLRLNTQYAEVKVKTVKTAVLTSQYTDLKISNLATSVDADMAYGALVLENLNRNFSEVRLNGKYTDFRLEIEKGAAFRFDAEGSYADLKYPNGATVRNKTEKGSWGAVSGFVGEENAKALIKAKLNYGDLVLR